MEKRDLRKICAACIAAGRPVTWIRDNCPETWSAFGFNEIYSVYMQERKKALYGPGVNPATFLY